MIHRLKTVNPYFQLAWEKRKPFEYRKDDRSFHSGDTVVLVEYLPDFPETPPREIHGEILYVLRNFDGLPKDYCVFGYKEIIRIDPEVCQ